MTIHRIHRTEGFAVIPNHVLRDENLSYRARGILAMMLTHTDGWRMTMADMIGASPKGRDGRIAVSAALAELEDVGYRKTTKFQNDAGQWQTVIDWFDSTEARGTECREPDSRVVGTYKNTMTENHEEVPLVASDGDSVSRSRDGFLTDSEQQLRDLIDKLKREAATAVGGYVPTQGLSSGAHAVEGHRAPAIDVRELLTGTGDTQ